ncbi:MAG: UDP-2,3-diacylglucosamine diphosphatase [Burkholderiales bacterium]
MPAHSLFISDLHLCPTRPRITGLFFEFLESTALRAQALYILGDLFEYWAGDDDAHDPHHAEIIKRIATLAQQGVAVFLMHGNRDFLMAGAFCEASGAGLLHDPHRVDLYGTPTLLMHGDTLCSDDVEYQKFRSMVRDPVWQTRFLSQPLARRKQIIEDFRQRSEAAKGKKEAEIMDVNLETVEATLRRQGYPRLIHGHTHRPAKHLHAVDDRTCERWVLNDWYEHGGYLRCDADGCQALTI